MDFSRDELVLINNALKEVLGGPQAIEEWEFNTRSAVTGTRSKRSFGRCKLLEAACNLDPYNEDVAQQALRAHARSGDTDAVKTRMRRLRAALDELDESPDDQTETLARALLSTSPPARGSSAPPSRPNQQ